MRGHKKRGKLDFYLYGVKGKWEKRQNLIGRMGEISNI